VQSIAKAKKTQMMPDFAARIAKLPLVQPRPNLIRFLCDDKVLVALGLNAKRRAAGPHRLIGCSHVNGVHPGRFCDGVQYPELGR
jgi:hypothetical protein